jgi:hypothetical protein
MVPAAGVRQEGPQSFPPLGKKIKTLLVWPEIPNSFWAFSGMLELLSEKVVMPPLGLITVAAAMAAHPCSRGSRSTPTRV